MMASPAGRLRLVSWELPRGGPNSMLHAGLDLSRRRLDFHLLDAEGATLEIGSAPPDADGLRRLTHRLDRHGAPIRAAIESMNGGASSTTATSAPRPARQAARGQGRPGRPRAPTGRGDLAHAHPQPALRSGRRHRPPGRPTVLKEMRYRSELPVQPDPPHRGGDREMSTAQHPQPARPP